MFLVVDGFLVNSFKQRRINSSQIAFLTIEDHFPKNFIPALTLQYRYVVFFFRVRFLRLLIRLPSISKRFDRNINLGTQLLQLILEIRLFSSFFSNFKSFIISTKRVGVTCCLASLKRCLDPSGIQS